MSMKLLSKNDRFESQRLLYRGIQRKDAENIVKWRSVVDVYQYSLNPRPLTLAGHLAWFDESYLLDKTRYDFVVETKESLVPIGVFGVYDINLQEKSAYLSYLIGEKQYQGKGFAREAVDELMCFFCNKAGIKLFCALVNKKNASSIKLLKKQGFLFNGTQGEFHKIVKRV